MTHGVSITPGTEDDLPRITEILNELVASSIATFDTRPKTVAGLREWFAKFSGSGPHRLLVARREGAVLGYAASSGYRDHDAFRETVEVSIAVDRGCRGHGIGALLYSALLEALAGEPVHVMVAGIALPNDASVALHRRFGFTEVGTFTEYAIKNGEYLSSVWMQRLNG